MAVWTLARATLSPSSAPTSPLCLSSSSSRVPNHSHLSFPISLSSASRFRSFNCVRQLSTPKSTLHMDPQAPELKPPEQEGDGLLPELLTEFMVDMKCDSCVSAVKNKLQNFEGVRRVDVDLNNQVVRVLGTLSVKTMIDALEQTGRQARLIGQGSPGDFLISSAVAEFKGPIIFGVVRVAQVNMELARIEASFSGLSSGKHGWDINEFGDLTKGASSTGKVFNPGNQATFEKPLGDLGTLEANVSGEAHFSGVKQMLRVADLIGRSIVVYEAEDKSDPGIAAAVIARSAGVGENYKKICTCDGVTIWESS